MSLADCIYVRAKEEAFITLKDHKENFRKKSSCRLINPCKPEIGKVSKQILEKIIREIKEKIRLNQWKNTNDTLTWLSEIKLKNKQSFITLDICDFYPSIDENQLNYALEFARVTDFDGGDLLGFVCLGV